MSLSLNIIIVGAGIGGLAAALALRRAGHKITARISSTNDNLVLTAFQMYERYDSPWEKNDIGNGLVLPNNSARVMAKHFGFDLKAAGMILMRKGLLVNAQTLEVIRETDGENVVEKYGHGIWMGTRKIVHDALYHAVTTAEDGKDPVQVTYGVNVVDYDEENGVIVLADGSTRQADLIVCADGLHSRGTAHVAGRESKPSPNGVSAFRFVVPTDQVKAIPGIDVLFGDNDGVARHIVDFKGHIMVWFPAHHLDYQTMTLVFPDKEAIASKESWSAKCDRTVVLDEFVDYHAVIKEVLGKAEDVGVWKICTREPLKSMFRGRLILIGDALHPMPPHKAQGASQAVEDAAALGILLSSLKTGDANELQKRLKKVQEVRLGRASTIQLMSAVRQDEGPQRPLEVLQECRIFFPDDPTPTESAENFQSWLFGHDVVAESHKALETGL